MNFPDIDWKSESIRPFTQYKQLHKDFLDALHENGLEQIITEPTHIHGNTLDLICTNNPNYVMETDVVVPGLSDHYLITAVLDHRRKQCKPDNFTITQQIF